jgi:hypothetical protein
MCRRTVERVAQWQFPAESSHGATTILPWLRWGIAAALLLGFGFMLGRTNTFSDDAMARLRREVERNVRNSLAADLRSALDDAQVQSTTTLGAMEQRLNGASTEQINRVVRNVVAAVNSVRDEDRDATRALIETVRKNCEGEIRMLRTDLETVASHADDQLRFANLQLRQLTARPSTKDTP